MIEAVRDRGQGKRWGEGSKKEREKWEASNYLPCVLMCLCTRKGLAYLILSASQTHFHTVSLSLSLFQYPLPKAVSLFLSFLHILLNSCLKFSFTYHYILLCSTTISLHKLQFTNSLPFIHSVLTLFLAM